MLYIYTNGAGFFLPTMPMTAEKTLLESTWSINLRFAKSSLSFWACAWLSALSGSALASSKTAARD